MRKGESGKDINVTEELVKLTSNVISHMMLSIRCSENEGEAEAARTVIREVTQIFGEFDVSDIIWFCKNLDLQGIRKRSEDIQRRYDALLEKIITDREKARRIRGGGCEASDFLDMLLDVMESGKTEVKFTREHLKALILVSSLSLPLVGGLFCDMSQSFCEQADPGKLITFRGDEKIPTIPIKSNQIK